MKRIHVNFLCPVCKSTKNSDNKRKLNSDFQIAIYGKLAIHQVNCCERTVKKGHIKALCIETMGEGKSLTFIPVLYLACEFKNRRALVIGVERESGSVFFCLFLISETSKKVHLIQLAWFVKSFFRVFFFRSAFCLVVY